MKLIDKDVLVVEIERRRDAALMRQQNLESIGQESVINEMVAKELNRIIFIIDTLEVKEVDSTDAFIEKAISWLKEQNEMIGVSFQEDFLERFQNYMKRE